jgi:hypothetical protein
MNYDNYYKKGGMTKEESISAIALRIGARKDAVEKFVEEHKIDTNKLNSDLKSGDVYFMDVITAIVGKPNNKYQKEVIKKYGNKMAMGGKTQGYDDREDERLGMKYGKMSGKDFDGSHDMREHSRRDDARFEERMEKGGELTYDDFMVGDFYSNSSEGGKFKFVGKDESGRLRFEDSKGINRIFSPKRMSKYSDGGMMAHGGKLYYTMNNVGKAKYVVNYHDGSKTHKDGSPFYDIDIFSNRKDFDKAVNKLESEGYKYRYADGGMMADGGEVYYVRDFYPNYDEDKIASILKSMGAKKVRKAKLYGWSNQPDVVVFEGDKNKAQEILEKEFPDNYISIYEKDWGRKMADGGETERDKNGMLYALQEHVSSGEIASKTNASKYVDIDQIRSKAIQYYVENGDKPYSYAELDSVLKKFDHTTMADGGQIDEDTLWELSSLVMDSINPENKLSLDEFLYAHRNGEKPLMTDKQEKLVVFVLKRYDDVENITEKTLNELATLVMDSINSDVHLPLYKFMDEVPLTYEQEELCAFVLGMFDYVAQEYFLVKDSKTFEKGGAIENQYKNRSAQDIWESWTQHQKFHFLTDHKQHPYYNMGKEKFVVTNADKEKYMNMSYEELPKMVKLMISDHIEEGEYEKGGAIKGSNPSTGERFGVVLGSLQKEDGITFLTIRSMYSSRINSYELRFDEKGFLYSIGDFGYSTDGTFPDMNGRASVRNINADNKKESIDALAKITSPSFAKKVYDYVQEEKMAKGGETKNKWEYTDVDEIDYVIVKDKSGKELKFDGKYVISGVHDLLEKGGKLTEIGKYYSKNDVVSVVVNGKNILDKNTVSGVWIKKDAKPMAEDVADIKIGKTTLKKGYNGWVAKTMVDNFKGFDWDITTIKNSRGDLTTTAQGGKSEDKGGYKMFTFMIYQDPAIRLKSSRPARVTDKVVSAQHEEAMKDFKERQDEIAEMVDQIQAKKKMADGGAIGFDALAKKVAKNYEGDNVKKQYQKEYGKTYDKQEAEEVGKKVAAKVYRQQQAKGKMAKGGTTNNRSNSKMTQISRKASEIRKANESWRDAFNRAKAMIG